MGALVHMPVVARPAFHDPAWREQYARECAAQCDAVQARPARTRPLLVIDNARRASADDYVAEVLRRASELREGRHAAHRFPDSWDA